MKIIIGTVVALFALTVEAAPEPPTNLRVVTPQQPDKVTAQKKPTPDPFIVNQRPATAPAKPKPDPFIINH